MAENHPVDPALLKKTFQLCSSFGVSLLGRRTARELLHRTHQVVLPYFQALQNFHLTESGQLEIRTRNPGDKEVLSFAVWMQVFLKEIKALMVGLGKVRIEAITEEIRPQLEKIGFYDYFYQSAELDYS